MVLESQVLASTGQEIGKAAARTALSADLNLNVSMSDQGILEPGINPLGQRLLTPIAEPAG